MVSVTVSENESLKAVKGSSADIVVPAEIYSGWHAVFASATADHTIGEYRQPVVTAPFVSELAVILIVIAAIALASVAIITVIVTKKKKAPESRVIGQIGPSEQKETAPMSAAGEAERIALLTERQRMIIKLTLEGKTREEIATILRFSVGTIKFDLTDIYRKLGCSSRTDLIIRYKDYF